MRTSLRKTALIAASTLLLCLSVILRQVGVDSLASITLIGGIIGAGATALLLLKRVGDGLSHGRALGRKADRIEHAIRSMDRLDERLATSEAAIRGELAELRDEVGLTGQQIDLVGSSTREGTAQIERVVQEALSRISSPPNESLTREPASLSNAAVSDLMQEIEALLRLRERVPLPWDGPLHWGYALSPRGMLQIVELIEREQPQRIVELGSGLSTVYLARYVEQGVVAEVVSVEHDDRYLERTRAILEAAGLLSHVRILHSPLTEVEIDGRTFTWYDMDTDLIGTIDMLLVDGPPGSTHERARYPAGPLLGPRMRAGGLIVLDDTHRDDERSIMRTWSAMFGLTRLEGLTPRQSVLRTPLHE